MVLSCSLFGSYDRCHHYNIYQSSAMHTAQREAELAGFQDTPTPAQTDAERHRLLPNLSAPGTNTWLRKSMDDYGNGVIAHWPLYSLLPSINRVSHNNCGEFPADPRFWPFRFEWDYGRRWLLAGNTKAVLPDGPVVRDNSAHKSTYD